MIFQNLQIYGNNVTIWDEILFFLRVHTKIPSVNTIFITHINESFITFKTVIYNIETVIVVIKNVVQKRYPNNSANVTKD